MSKYLRDQAWRHINKANSQIQRGQYNNAFASLETAEQFAQEAKVSDVLSVVFGTRASVFQSMGMFDEALKMHTTALNIQEDLAKIEPLLKMWVATTLNNLGILLSDMGKPEDAKDQYDRALKIYEGILATDSQNIVYQSDVSMTLNNLGTLLKNMGKPEDAKDQYDRALQIREAILETDKKNIVYQSDVSMTLNNLGNLLKNMNKPKDAKDQYERAFQIYEAILETDKKNIVYQSNFSLMLNNLGTLLSVMGEQEEAKNRYERALQIYEGILETDKKNIVYQSDVSITLNNLGTLLSVMGQPEEALNCYQKSLGIYTKPMQYLTIKTKTKAIVNIIQLVSGCAEESTNTYRKLNDFKKVYETYIEHEDFFSKYELVHERQLVKEAGLSAHIQHLMINARNEDDKEKRIVEYETCIREVEQIAKTEDDEKLKELWISVIYYLKGRQFVNMAMQSDPPNRELMEKAIKQFESAKDRYKQANVCYCIYTVLLELESIEVLDDEAVSRMKNLLKHATESLPEKMDNSVRSAFHEIEVLLDNKNLKTDPEMFERLNKCITKIDYYALREHFNHISCKIMTYLKEPFSLNVSYSNWELHITFDEPENVQGKLTIKADDRIIFDEPLQKRHKIHPKHRPQTKDETITFITEKGRNVTREITYSEGIKCDDGYIDVHFLEHDCKRPNTGEKFNIAIVQLKYHLQKEGHTLVIEDDEAYHKKVTTILDAVKEKTDLIVFPEFSIPSDYLPEMKRYSDENGIVIVAGSHYVTDATLDNYSDMFDHKFDENELLKNISPVIIPSSGKIYHTEKILPAKAERSLFFEEGMTQGTLNRIFKLNGNVIFGVMICFDFINDKLRKRITDACNIVLVPQTNPSTGRFYKIGDKEFDNPRWAENKAYIMANGIFTYNDRTRDNDGKKIMGGNSGVILTLDKDTAKNSEKPIINSVHEQAIMLASLNMNFFSARDIQIAQIPVTCKLINIFEESEVLKSEEDGKNPQAFFDLLEKIDYCEDKNELKQLLADNDSLIRSHSPLMHEKISGDLANLRLDEIKDRCANIIIKRLAE